MFLGYRGVPFEETTFLVCEIALANSKTGIGIFADNHSVAAQTIPVSIDLGKRQWKLKSLGSDVHGQDPGSFEFHEVMLATTAWGQDSRDKLWENTNSFYKLKYTCLSMACSVGHSLLDFFRRAF